MILVFDVGNSNIVVGVIKGDQLVNHWRLRTDNMRTSDEYGMHIRSLFAYHGLDMASIKAVVISSVVPSLNIELELMSQTYFYCKPLVVGPGVKTGLPIKYDNPRDVGADRVVNAVAAYHKNGWPLIKVDIGTATTFCVVNKKGEYLGGANAPGIRISNDALFARAAKLPRVELVKPRNIIGRNTVASMQSGIIYGFVGQVEGIINRMKREIEGEPKVIATGGLAKTIAQETDTIHVVDEYLALDGLRIIYEIDRG